MTTEEQIQSTDIQQINGTEDDSTHEHDGEPPATPDNSSAPPVRRSRFFRSKRKQRLNEDQSHPDDNDDEESKESADSLENPEQSSVEEVSTSDTNTPIKQTSTKLKRPSSPPPPPPPTDDTDEPDGNSASEETRFSSSNEDLNTDRQAYVTKKTTHEKLSSAQARPSLPTLYSGYERKKSQSVKLTRIGPLDAYPKKNVRFADDFGLDLSQVKVITSDELPHVPSAAFKDLHISQDYNPSGFYQERMKTITYLEQKFENPIHTHGFEARVDRHKVVLEQANAIDNRIYGTVKIVSFGLNKRIRIRLTTDSWKTYRDYDATYITDSFDGTHDRFTFTIEIERDRIRVENHIQFCIGYESYTVPDYWDNNYNQNYRFACISRTIPDYSG